MLYRSPVPPLSMRLLEQTKPLRSLRWLAMLLSLKVNSPCRCQMTALDSRNLQQPENMSFRGQQKTRMEACLSMPLPGSIPTQASRANSSPVHLMTLAEQLLRVLWPRVISQRERPKRCVRCSPSSIPLATGFSSQRRPSSFLPVNNKPSTSVLKAGVPNRVCLM